MQTKIIIFFFISTLLLAQEKTFVREYTHKVGDADSKITSRIIALNQVKTILLEEIGVYIESTFEIKTTETNKEIKELTQNQIVSITAGITETKILKESWNGVDFYIKAKITLDIDEIKSKIGEIAKSRDKTKLLVEANNKAKQANAELNIIREKLKKTKSENEKLQLQLEYAKTSDKLSASDWFQKGLNAIILGEQEEAIVYFNKSTELGINSHVTCLYLGLIFAENENYNEAIKYYYRAIELEPNNAEAYMFLGLVFAKNDNYNNAIDYLEKAIKLESDNLTKAEIYNNLGWSFSKKGILGEAIKSYKKSILLNPNDHLPYYNMGNTYKSNSDYNNAIKSYENAIKINPNYADAYDKLGQIYKNNGKFNLAISHFHKAIELDPNFAGYYNQMGSVYRAMNSPEQAIYYYKKAIDLDPNNAIINFNIGAVYGGSGNNKKAIEHIRIAARLGLKTAQDFLNQNNIEW